jgi:GH25 family lysozyme M1 (1,4-beta-N-acetylmuramidase)
VSLYGVDISDYQAGFDVGAYARAGHRYIILKASEGATWRSREMRGWREAAHTRGLALVGLYHFLRENPTGAEVDNFFASIGSLREREVPILDWEAGGSSEQARAWLERVEARTGRRPILYSYAPYLAAHPTAALTRWPLWIAAYGSDDGREHPWPGTDRWARFESGPGTYPHEGRAIMWQYSSNGSVAGYGGRLDVNRFDGTEADLLRLGGVETQIHEKEDIDMLMFWHGPAIFLDFHGRISPWGLRPETVEGLRAAGVRVMGKPGDDCELFRMFSDFEAANRVGPEGRPAPEYPVEFLERNGWLADFLRSTRA